MQSAHTRARSGGRFPVDQDGIYLRADRRRLLEAPARTRTAADNQGREELSGTAGGHTASRVVRREGELLAEMIKIADGWAADY